MEAQSKDVCDARHEALAGLIATLQKNHEIAEAERKGDLEKIYKKLEEFGQRLPTWAVALAATGSMVIGILATKVAGH